MTALSIGFISSLLDISSIIFLYPSFLAVVVEKIHPVAFSILSSNTIPKSLIGFNTSPLIKLCLINILFVSHYIIKFKECKIAS